MTEENGEDYSPEEDKGNPRAFPADRLAIATAIKDKLSGMVDEIVDLLIVGGQRGGWNGDVYEKMHLEVESGFNRISRQAGIPLYSNPSSLAFWRAVAAKDDTLEDD